LRYSLAIFVAGFMAFGLLIEGCGGGDSTAQKIDKATFVKQANRICEQVSGKFAAELSSVSSRESAKPGYDFAKTQVTIVKEVLIPGLEEELKEIRALGMPAEAKRDVESFLGAYQRSIAKVKAKPQSATGATIPYEAVEVTGTAFGVSECPVTSLSAG
jgi:hypothetical protein